MAEQKIAWEPHPVSRERKAELRAQGFTIIDARFKPSGANHDVAGNDGVLPDAEQRAMLTADLTERGIEFDESAPTDELRALSIQPAPKRRGRPPKDKE